MKIECLQVKLSMTVYPEQEYYMFTQGGHVFEKLNSEFSLRFPGYFQTFPRETRERKVRWNTFSLMIMTHVSHFPTKIKNFPQFPLKF